MLALNRREFFLSAAMAAATRPAQASAQDLPYRQVHLDFHTSELITDVAADFDAAGFARTLRNARVNSINVFAKCHHGWAYYDTSIAARHPSLKIDLLAR